MQIAVWKCWRLFVLHCALDKDDSARLSIEGCLVIALCMERVNGTGEWNCFE